MNNRVIKFRAWDKKEKRWAYPTEVCLEAGGTYWHWCNKDDQSKLLNCPDIELSQFTGLKDKNEKEIYEGDIVKAIATKNYPKNTTVSDIIFSDDFQWVVRSTKGYKHGLHLKWGGWESLEIIGNIYENSELLK